MKVRTIKKTVAALVVATAATAGMSGAAFATKNTGKYQQSAEAHRQGQPLSCTDSWNQFEKAVNDAHKADQKGQKAVRNTALAAADGAVADGQQAGCDWVAPQ